ncbi:MAG: sigma-70 family RNA polymerase sigma factor [Planctomycetes bacterium]|nr:sigma-70 family RNA polymerase sigma factor [Planctomycetota bacterium]MCG2684598.1 sigma-70 family RNA polymerase sigma factor [Planctomycetales bacterium]
MPESNRTDEFVREFTRCAQRLYAYIFTLMGHDSGADDVFQEASALAWEKFGEFQPGSNFLAWICRIARFRALSYFDSKRRRPRPFSDAFLDAVEADMATMSDALDGEMLALADCYRKLLPEDRELIDRRYTPGADTRQVAAAVGRPLSTVYRMLARVHRELLECIEQAMRDKG